MVNLQNRVAWIHRSAITLKATDLVELKFSLKKLITEATETLDVVRQELHTERKRLLEMQSKLQGVQK